MDENDIDNHRFYQVLNSMILYHYDLLLIDLNHQFLKIMYDDHYQEHQLNEDDQIQNHPEDLLMKL